MSQLMGDVDALRQLDEKQILIFNAEVARTQKSVGVAYLLFLFLGGFGAHAIYMGSPLKAVAYILLTLSAIPLAFIPIVPLAIMGLWDLFTIPRQIRLRDEQIRRDLIAKIAATGSTPRPVPA